MSEFDRASMISDRITLVGDLNCDLHRSNLPQSKSFLGFMRQFGLDEIVKESTRVTHNTADVIATSVTHNTADVIATNCSDHFSLLGLVIITW